MNTVTVSFNGCEPAPSNGYKVLWRVAGSATAYISAGNFFISPAIFYDDTNPEGTEYEGVIRSDCGAIWGSNFYWSTLDSGGESGEESGATGNPVWGAVGNSQEGLCSQMLEALWLDPDHFVIQPGAIVYYDEALTTPVTGFDYLMDESFIIFFLNSFNSHVGSPTGFAC